MANYDSQSSSIISCTYEQALMATVAFDQLNNEMSQATLSMIESNGNTRLSPLDEMIRHAYRNHPDYVPGSVLDLFSWDFDVAIETSNPDNNDSCEGLYIGSDTHFNSEHAAAFLQAFLHAFNKHELVTMEIAHTCSRHLPEAFGGHAVVISKDHVRFHHSQHFFSAEHEAHNSASRHYMCSLVQVNGEHHYSAHFLLQCHRDINPNRILRKLYDHPAAMSATDDVENWEVEYDDGTCVQQPVVREIEPTEFATMKNYLPVQCFSDRCS